MNWSYQVMKHIAADSDFKGNVCKRLLEVDGTCCLLPLLVVATSQR